MLSTVTRPAPSLSLQTCQEISGETRLLQARAPGGARGPPRAPGRDGEGRLAEQPGRAWVQDPSAREDALQEEGAEMLAASRQSPPPRATFGESQWVQRFPRAQVRSPLQPLPTPNANSARGLGVGAPALFSLLPKLVPTNFPARPPWEGEAKALQEARHPRGTRGEDSPPRAALGAPASGRDSEAPHRGPRAAAAPGGSVAHGLRGSPVRPALRSSAPAPAPAAAGAALSGGAHSGPQLVI